VGVNFHPPEKKLGGGMKKLMKRRVYNAFEAAKLLGIGHNQVRKLVRSGELRAFPTRNIVIPDVALEEYLATVRRGGQ
jgi:excisionase family DNA binding protein